MSGQNDASTAGPLTREWQNFLELLHQKKAYGAIEIEIVRLAFFFGARTVFSVMSRSPIAVVHALAEAREFDRSVIEQPDAGPRERVDQAHAVQ